MGAVACSKAIPTVTTLAGPTSLTPKDAQVDSGGGLVTSTNYKVFGKVSGAGSEVLSSSNYRVHVNGDN